MAAWRPLGTASRGGAEDEAGDGELARSVNEDFDFAVGPADVVEADALADDGALPRGEAERAAADGRAELIVAVGGGWDAAHGGVLGGVGREVRVELALALGRERVGQHGRLRPLVQRPAEDEVG